MQAVRGEDSVHSSVRQRNEQPCHRGG